MGKNKKKCAIPKHELESLAEVLCPTLKEYLECTEGKTAYKKWREQEKKKSKQGMGKQ